MHPFNRTEPFVSKEFNLIIGNPPWTGLKSATAPRDPDAPLTGRQWSLEYCKRNNVPDKKPDLAFILRSRDFANAKTKIAFIVCSRLLYQEANRPQGQRWLDTFLQFNSANIVINLSDFVGENVLFGGRSSTRLPATALIFRTVRPRGKSGCAVYYAQVVPAIRQQAELTITAGDVHHIAQSELYDRPFLWKSAFRGTPRDFRLLVKLKNTVLCMLF